MEKQKIRTYCDNVYTYKEENCEKISQSGGYRIYKTFGHLGMVRGDLNISRDANFRRVPSHNWKPFDPCYTGGM